MKISANFNWEDFVKVPLESLTEAQRNMATNLALNIFQPIRDYLKIPIVITNSMRLLTDFDRLIAEGYNPSPKSDHFYGFKPDTVGAADAVTQGRPVEDVFNELIKFVDKKDYKLHLPNRTVEFGQMILEVKANKDGSVVKWIHISNPKEMFSNLHIDPINRVLRSLDNGKTFTSAI